MYTHPQSDLDNEHEPILASSQSEDDIHLRTLAEANSALSSTDTPTYPCWPTSQPGLLAKEPGRGERSINPQRREQMVSLGDDGEEYNANS
jgi:hypothetical protein